MEPVTHPRNADAAGQQQTTPMFLVENHDEAYFLWRDAGVRAMTLVHVDAHHDMWPIKLGSPTTIGDFIFRAMREGIVGDVIWVVPDGALAAGDARDQLMEGLQALDGLKVLWADERSISAKFLGRNLTVCKSTNLPAFESAVLLDIDVDYFLLPEVSTRAAEVPLKGPWSWPEALVHELQGKSETRMITIAYSVNGGTTPMRWKYLGDELAARLGDDGAENELRYFPLIREAWESRARGVAEEAESLLRQAVNLRQQNAAACWHLAELLAERENWQDAIENYQRAIEADASYDSPYNCAGPCLEEAGSLDEAADEYRHRLAFDASNAHALLGMGSIAATKKDWAVAKEYLQKAVAANGNLPDAHRLLGDAYFLVNDQVAALREYQQYMRLIRAGHRCLRTSISTYEDVEDVFFVPVRARMARLYRALGERNLAEKELRWLSARSVPRTTRAGTRAAHARTLFELGRKREALSAFASAFATMPHDALRAMRSLSRAGDGRAARNPLRDICLNAVRMGVMLLCAMATSAIIARSLGPEMMGLYGYTLWLSGVMVALCHLGLPTSLTKFVAERFGSGDQVSAARTGRQLLIWQAGAVLVVMFTGAMLLRSGIAGREAPWTLAVLLVAPQAMQQALAAALVGAQRYRGLAMIGAWSAIVQVMFVALAAGGGATVERFLLAILVANIFSAWLYYRPVRAGILRRDAGAASTNGLEKRRLLRFAGPVAYLVLLDMVVWQRSEIFFLRAFSVWREIAFYSVAYLVVSKLNDAVDTAAATLLPAQSREAQDPQAMARRQERAICALQMVLLPTCATVTVAARPLIKLLYGTAYLPLLPVLWLLLLSPFAVSVTDVTIAGIYALGRQRSLMIPLSGTAAVNLLLAYLLVPRWGALGAAGANTAAQLMEGIFLLVFSSAMLSCRAPWKRLARIYAAAAVAFTPAITVAWAGPPFGLSVIMIAGGCLLYAVLLVWMGEVTSNDWKMIREAVFPPEAQSYAG